MAACASAPGSARSESCSVDAIAAPAATATATATPGNQTRCTTADCRTSLSPPPSREDAAEFVRTITIFCAALSRTFVPGGKSGRYRRLLAGLALARTRYMPVELLFVLALVVGYSRPLLVLVMFPLLLIYGGMWALLPLAVAVA